MFSNEDVTDDKFLGGQINLLQPKVGYRAGTDPVFLAAACLAKPGQSVLELGCGVGTALLCLNARVSVQMFGVERLAQYADLAVRNFDRNGATGEIITSDLDAMPITIRDRMYDHVIINPPFYRDGHKAHDAGRAGGRQEETPLENWIDHALKRTKPKGYITLVHLTERLSDLISLLSPRVGDVEIKPLVAREGRLPKRIIIRARKGASGGTSLYNPLILHDGLQHDGDRDSFTHEAKSILRDGFSLRF